MKILALDSSGLTASVAVIEDENLMGEYTMNYKKTHSQTLLPMLDELAKMIELDPAVHRCDRRCRRTGFLYRTSYRFCYGKRVRTSTGQTHRACSDGGRACIQSLGP